MVNEISTVSLFEYVSLIGHYNKLLLTTQIDPRLLTRGYTKEQIEQMKLGMNKMPKEIISLDVHFKCNLEEIEVGYFAYAITTYDAYHRHGVLPYPGSLSDQPNKIIEIFNIMDALRMEREQQQAEQQKREQAKEQRRRK